MHKTPVSATGPAKPPALGAAAVSRRMRGAQRRAGRMLRAMAPPLFTPAEASAASAGGARVGTACMQPRSGAPPARGAPPPHRAAPWAPGGSGPLRGQLAGPLAASSRDASTQAAAAAAAPATLHSTRDDASSLEAALSAGAAVKATAGAGSRAARRVPRDAARADGTLGLSCGVSLRPQCAPDAARCSSGTAGTKVHHAPARRRPVDSDLKARALRPWHKYRHRALASAAPSFARHARAPAPPALLPALLRPAQRAPAQNAARGGLRAARAPQHCPPLT